METWMIVLITASAVVTYTFLVGVMWALQPDGWDSFEKWGVSLLWPLVLFPWIGMRFVQWARRRHSIPRAQVRLK